MLDPVDVHVGRTIRLLRQQREISQSALSRQVGVTIQQLQKYEKGSSRVTPSRLIQLAQALGADINIFFDCATDLECTNDNFPPAELLTKQGLTLLKAFQSIPDAAVRVELLDLVLAASQEIRPRPI